MPRYEHLLHLDMDDLRHANGTDRNDDDGGLAILSVVPFREEDSACQKVAGDAEKKDEDEEDRETQLRGSFRLRVHEEEGDGGTGIMSQKNSRRWTDCLCFKQGHEPEDDSESRAAGQRGKLI